MSEIRVSIYEKEDGTYQVSFINPLDQKRKRHTFKTKEEADRYRNEIIIQHSKGALLPSGKRYIGHLLQTHLQRKPSSRVTERKNIFEAFCRAFNHFEVEHLSKDALDHWLSQLQTENGYTDRNMSRIKSQLNHFMSWLVDEEILSNNPLDRIRFKIGAPKRARVILSKYEVKALLDQLKAHSPKVLFPYVFTIVHTGARRGEVQKLKWEDVDFETAFIHFRKTKNGEDRRVRMSRILHELLESHPRTSEHVFVDEEGKPLHRAKIQRGIARFKKEYPDQKDWKCHDLRHSFAYNFLKRGGEMYQLKALLGHKTIQMTVDLYGNLKAGDIENPSPYENW
ncbi:MAG: hypothetical protein A2X94_13595 [Bdellovibrionales bacterium GWB1_55_8]|nr:MAG: hypothetical protein A2X94_13595 [Bdellovibrionales bacterium GWB1_55_8]